MPTQHTRTPAAGRGPTETLLFLHLAVAHLALAACGPTDPGREPEKAAAQAQPEPEPGNTEPGNTEPAVPADPAATELKRRVYVPAYSHVPAGGGRRTMLHVILSIRNVDTRATVRLDAVDYFDTSGRRVRRYLETPRALGPLATAEFTVDVMDDIGGSGANFLVDWSGSRTAHSLLTEAVMVGHAGQGYLSFTSRGVELDLGDGD